MTSTSLEALLKLVKKHNLDVNTPLDGLLDQLAGISSEHATLLNAIAVTINNSKHIKNASPKEFFTDCPECGSQTLLNFSECHLCGHELTEPSVDEVKEEPKKEKAAPKKEAAAPKKEKAAPKKTKVEEEDEYEDVPSPYKKKNTEQVVIEPEDDFEEELDNAKHKEPAKKATTKVKQEILDEDDFDFEDEEEEIKPKAKTTPKKEEPKKAEKPLPEEEDDLDFDFEDEEEVKPKAKAATAKKEEPKKDKAAPKKGKKVEADDELGDLNDDFDIEDFDIDDDAPESDDLDDAFDD